MNRDATQEIASVNRVFDLIGHPGYSGKEPPEPPDMELAERVAKLEVIAENTAKAIDRLDRSMERIDRSLSDVRADVDRKFTWMIGTQIATLLAIVGILARAAHIF